MKPIPIEPIESYCSECLAPGRLPTRKQRERWERESTFECWSCHSLFPHYLYLTKAEAAAARGERNASRAFSRGDAGA